MKVDFTKRLDSNFEIAEDLSAKPETWVFSPELITTPYGNIEVITDVDDYENEGGDKNIHNGRYEGH